LLGAKLIACPGCYPTCTLLALLPAIDADMIDVTDIIIDAKSGVTGAGRKALASLSFSEIADGAHAYAVGAHRHAPELSRKPVTFGPVITAASAFLRIAVQDAQSLSALSTI